MGSLAFAFSSTVCISVQTMRLQALGLRFVKQRASKPNIGFEIKCKCPQKKPHNVSHHQPPKAERSGSFGGLSACDCYVLIALDWVHDTVETNLMTAYGRSRN